MSFTQEIKNYIYFLINFDNQNSFGSLLVFFQYNCCYIIQFLKNWCIIFFDFHWFSDFVYLSISLPKWNASLIKDFFLFQSPQNFVYDYNYIQNNTSNLFFIGLGNSLFYWIPHSSVHFLILRRFLVEGLPAGIMAVLGSLMAHIFVISITLFGFGTFFYPWLDFEVGIYLFGICFVFILMYNLVHTPLKRSRFQNKKKLLIIFCVHFVFILCENYGIFPYLSSLTLHEGVDSLQSQNWTILNNFIYICGFVSGSIFFILSFGILISHLSQFLSNSFSKSYSHWIQTLNFTFLTLILANILASFPFYSLDYLVLSSMGFYSEDLRNQISVFKTDIPDIPKGRLGEYSAHSSIDTDIALYNRARYSTGHEIELTFEDLNFQGEYIWRTRSDRLASGSVGIINPFMAKFLPKQTQIQKKEEQANKDKDLKNTHLLLLQNSTNFENLLTRFCTDYNAEVLESSILEYPIERESFSAFSELVKYGFDSFASLEDYESDEFEEELGKKIKQRYYKNNIYKILLNLDISNFIQRQPSMFSMTQKEENALFNKKLILNNYYNSLRSYSYLPYSNIFKILFNNTKSYANRVYNQQYKGTLKILRRLFLIDFGSFSSNLSLLKYDQLLYKENPFKNIVWHEEIEPKLSKRKLKALREYQSTPFYIGWDQTKRQLLITNRFVNSEKLFHLKNNFSNLDASLNFISWPVQKIQFLQNDQASFLFYQFAQTQNDLQKDLFSYREQGELDTQLIYDTLPTILQRVDLRNKDKSKIQLKTTRGGLIW
uniref:Ycf1 n=1 Tax=Codium fragile TaxID=3133 RepID=A0A6B9P3Y7_CODFR|nr:Ycf1 [Codium fragile]